MASSVAAANSVLPLDQEGEDEFDALPNVLTPRGYQIEALERAKKEDIIVYLETGCGKTHVAVMLPQHIADLIRKPSTRIAVFLCPSVPLVQQQARVVKRYTNFKVGEYYGEVNNNAWNSKAWEAELENTEIFVMTPAILLHNLHHCFMRMDCIELLIFDECHHAHSHHPYANIMQEFYHGKEDLYRLPRILGMTASPINGKVNCQGDSIRTKIDKIERMLHAKLHTVKESSELDLVVPRPHHKSEYYESAQTPNPVTLKFCQLLFDLQKECIGTLLGTSGCEGELLGELCSGVEKKRVKNVKKLCNSLGYCATELGPRCAYEAVKILLHKYDSDCDPELDSNSEGKKDMLRKILNALNSFLSKEVEATSCAVPDGAANIQNLSSKVQLLINVLERCRDTNEMRCIIFVERKITTRVLASLLSSIEVLSPAFRFQSLAGKNSGSNDMNHKHQQNVVESFRNGEVNVLVSTNVAEEGLDIQNCHLVIRFDLPNTPCSLIQSRGRARCLKSTIIYLIERGNNEQSQRLEQFLLTEESMKEEVLSRIKNAEDVGAPETSTIETFRVESTGATMSTLCSVSLLHQYCARLAHDSFYTPTPQFSYSEDGSGVKCTIKLPTDALVQSVEGRPVSSQADAKRVACLIACERLYDAGALTELLLLKSKENAYSLDAIAPESNSTTGRDPLPSRSIIVPDAFSGTWGSGLNSVELHAYAISFVATPNDRAYVNFGLFLEADMGPEAGSIEVELQLSNRRLVNAKCSPCGTILFEPDQLRNAKSFQERIFSSVLDQKPPVPNIELSGEWNSNRLYLLLPLKEKQDALPLSIDWDCIEDLISDVMKGYNTLEEVPSEIPRSSLLRLIDGYFPVEHVTNSLIQTEHTGKRCLYCARELIPDMNGQSPMIMKVSKYNSYSDYYLKKHNRTLNFVEQPMLKAKPLIQVNNLLTQRTTSERPAAEEQKTESLVELPLELCKIMVKGLSCALTNGISLLPSFMHRLEGLLLAVQFRKSLPSPHSSPVPANLMLEAITTSKCQESFSLEGLELLGDAFLEVSVSERLFLLHNRLDEGELSKRRTNLICNKMLERLGRERGIMNYIRDTQFSPKEWATPGRVRETQCKLPPLQGKTIADVFEALIGAHYIHGGVEAAQAMMGWLGCEVGVSSSIREEARTRVHGQLELLSEAKVSELEILLNYKFQNKGLLVEALTHASCRRHSGDCYQRLEFLGDAVLDFLITKHFYANSANLKRDPGLLTDLRSAAVNNECFARVAVRHNLHLYLLHNSSDLAARVDKYVHGSTTDAQCHGWNGDSGPKVLSDLVESLAGAVFLDSGYKLDTVWNVFKQLLKPLVTPATLRLEPIRELWELCQTEKFGEPNYKKKREAMGDFDMTVTVELKDETITGVGRKPDEKSARKVAAIQALETLKTLGYEHGSRRLERAALYARKFSDLVDVPEERCHSLVFVDEGTSILKNTVEIAGGKCATKVVDFAPAVPDPNSKQDGNPQTTKGEHLPIVDKQLQFTPPTESAEKSFEAEFVSSSSQPEVSSTSGQKDPPVTENSDFQKLCEEVKKSVTMRNNYFSSGPSTPNSVTASTAVTPVQFSHSTSSTVVPTLGSRSYGVPNQPRVLGHATFAGITFVPTDPYSGFPSSHAGVDDGYSKQTSSAPHLRPAPDVGLRLVKGEARSLLNAMCMKHRWGDPVYTLVSKGGVSHAPLFLYMVQTTIILRGRAFEIDAEGEVERDIKGAKDSAAARLLEWLGEEGFFIS